MPTYSAEHEIGSLCPDFSLPAVDGKQFKLRDFQTSQALLVAFICNHCPYVRAVEDRLLSLAHAYPSEKLQVIGICANDPTDYPEDAPSQLLIRWRDKNYGFPYLVDEKQDVARAFDAVCTPDLFLYDQKRNLYYHGRLDDSWKDQSQVKVQDLKNAIDGLLANQAPPMPQHPSMGCSIKWKKDAGAL